MKYRPRHAGIEPSGVARTAAAGFTLLELLIAITMGLFLIGGLVGIVFAIRTSFAAQDGLTQSQENTRFLLSVMNTTVHNAGYRPRTKVASEAAATTFKIPNNANADGTMFAAGQIIAGTTGGNNASDTLNVRFQTEGGDDILNCNGVANTTGANVIYTNSFALSGGQLTCGVSVDGGPADPKPRVLVENVSKMKMLFSVDTSPNLDRTLVQYLSAADVSAQNRWNTVGSVQIRLTLNDPINSRPGAPVDLPVAFLHTINLMVIP